MLETILSLKGVLLEGLGATLYMVAGSTIFSYLRGLPLGVLLYTTGKGGIHENLPLNRALGWIVNIGRSIPFIILIIALIPFTRLVAGKAIGPTAAIVPKRLANDPLFISAVQIRFGHAEREFCKDSKIVPFLSAMRVVK